MKLAYIDCFSGVAGDMTLASMIDAGVPLALFQQLIDRLKLPRVTMTAEKVKRHGIAATHVNVAVEESARKKHRHLPHIIKIIDEADLSDRVKRDAKAIFQKLGEAEATVHNSTLEKVHFHEVGANDAIVDIVGACLGFEHLGIDRIICSPIPTGSGTVTCEHGVMPVPPPATAQLLRGFPIAACDETGELATPTGVAIMTTLAASFGTPPTMRLIAVGVGAGTREGKTRANIMRILIGESDAAVTGLISGNAANAETSDTVAVLETQVDDATGQVVAYACEQVLSGGALDCFVVPIIMKKGRPGQLLTVLCKPESVAAIEQILLRETGTLGVRRHVAERTKLAREHVTVETRFGPIRVKLGRRDASRQHAWPEYEDCAAAARRTGASLAEVQHEALTGWARRSDVGGGG
ncbi:MAG: nickel pincer cofactor biosynthesis protein LarC [Phycisphaerae bacterium]